MTTCYVVVEAPTDAEILSILLETRHSSVQAEIMIGRGRSSAVSLARTMLVSRPDALTALVLDADTTDRQRISEMQAELEGSLVDVSRPERFGVFLFVPSIEACLFRDMDGLQDALGAAISTEQMVQSRYDPKAVLRNQLQRRDEDYNAKTVRAILDRLDVCRLQDAPVVRDLLEFVARSAATAPA